MNLLPVALRLWCSGFNRGRLGLQGPRRLSWWSQRCEAIRSLSNISSAVFMWLLRPMGQARTGLGEFSLSRQRRRKEHALQPSLCSPACAKKLVWALQRLLFGLFGQVRAMLFELGTLDNWTENVCLDRIPGELRRWFVWGVTAHPVRMKSWKLSNWTGLDKEARFHFKFAG